MNLHVWLYTKQPVIYFSVKCLVFILGLHTFYVLAYYLLYNIF